VYRPVVPVYTQFLDRSISAFQSISRNSEGHVESVQPIKCMIFILICNKYLYTEKVLELFKSSLPLFEVQMRQTQCRLKAWIHWAVARAPNEHRGPMIFYVCFVRYVFNCLNTDFVGSTSTINICLISSIIYIFIHASGCVGSGPSILLCPGV